MARGIADIVQVSSVSQGVKLLALVLGKRGVDCDLLIVSWAREHCAVVEDVSAYSEPCCKGSTENRRAGRDRDPGADRVGTDIFRRLGSRRPDRWLVVEAVWIAGLAVDTAPVGAVASSRFWI